MCGNEKKCSLSCSAWRDKWSARLLRHPSPNDDNYALTSGLACWELRNEGDVWLFGIHHQSSTEMFVVEKDQGGRSSLVHSQRVRGVWFIFTLFYLVLIRSLLCGFFLFCKYLLFPSLLIYIPDKTPLVDQFKKKQKGKRKYDEHVCILLE